MSGAHWYEWLFAIVVTAIIFGDELFGEDGRAKAAIISGGACVVALLATSGFYLWKISQ